MLTCMCQMSCDCVYKFLCICDVYIWMDVHTCRCRGMLCGRGVLGNLKFPLG